MSKSPNNPNFDNYGRPFIRLQWSDRFELFFDEKPSDFDNSYVYKAI